jgi:MarR family 2-MHQ and catechol resistance regulon transcriptional repressor
VTDPDVAKAVRVYVKLLRATRSVIGRLEPLLAAHGLTMTQFGVLELLLHQGPLPHREIGRKVLTSPGNLTDLVDKLQARGLVGRVRDPRDRRLVRVELTRAGRALVQDLFPRHATDIAATMDGLSCAELRVLEPLLRKLGMAAARDRDPALVDESAAP